MWGILAGFMLERMYQFMIENSKPVGPVGGGGGGGFTCCDNCYSPGCVED